MRKTKMVNGTTTTHVWDGSNIVLEVSGSSVVKYVSGINLIAQIPAVRNHGNAVIAFSIGLML